MNLVRTWSGRLDGKPRLAGLLALISGALIPLGMSPVSLWPASILGPALLLICLRGRTPVQGARIGWLFGLGLYGAGASWVYVSIHVYGYAPVWLAGGLTALFVAGLALMCGLLGWAWTRYFPTGTGSWMIAFPGVWVLIEWLREWLLTGFPWLYTGYAHTDTMLAGYAPVGGVFLVSFMSLMISGAVATLLRTDIDRGGRMLALLVGMLVFGTGLALQQADWTRADEGPMRVALVQGNVPQDLKWQQNNLMPQLELYRQLNSEISRADLVVWPEAAIPEFADRLQEYLQLVERELPPGAAWISGIPTRIRSDQQSRYFNSIMALGHGDGIYHKQKLVPFGEYVPLEQWLRGIIRFLDLPMSAFSAGSSAQQPLRILHQGRIVEIAPYICYEIVYPAFVAMQYRQAGVLLTISNDAWFGRSVGPWQHLQIARMRAIELRKPLLRATNNGVTAVIDNRGRVSAQLPQFERGILQTEIQPHAGLTPFAHWGSGPILVASLLLALLLRRRK